MALGSGGLLDTLRNRTTITQDINDIKEENSN
ncbi:hypothetical protein HMPREF0864_04818 [Enterobacteriaceae bacterium 9_2_54FAA]|jgi:hypothetical protein|nr:hypothetical protein HMPREF0864_04818 [Enterobacteriaceae bacterium 9_2_54FAA]